MRGTKAAGVSLPEDVFERVKFLGHGSLSAGVQRLAAEHLGHLPDPVAAITSTGATWLREPSVDSFALAIAGGARLICWRGGVLVGDPDSGCCVSIEREGITARDGEGQHWAVADFALSDLEKVAQGLERAHHEAVAHVAAGHEITSPLGARLKFGTEQLEIVAAGPGGARLTLGGAEVPLPGHLLMALASETRALVCRHAASELAHRRHLEKQLLGVAQ